MRPPSTDWPALPPPLPTQPACGTCSYSLVRAPLPSLHCASPTQPLWTPRSLCVATLPSKPGSREPRSQGLVLAGEAVVLRPLRRQCLLLLPQPLCELVCWPVGFTDREDPHLRLVLCLNLGCPGTAAQGVK